MSIYLSNQNATSLNVWTLVVSFLRSNKCDDVLMFSCHNLHTVIGLWPVLSIIYVAICWTEFDN